MSSLLAQGLTSSYNRLHKRQIAHDYRSHDRSRRVIDTWQNSASSPNDNGIPFLMRCIPSGRGGRVLHVLLIADPALTRTRRLPTLWSDRRLTFPRSGNRPTRKGALSNWVTKGAIRTSSSITHAAKREIAGRWLSSRFRLENRNGEIVSLTFAEILPLCRFFLSSILSIFLERGRRRRTWFSLESMISLSAQRIVAPKHLARLGIFPGNVESAFDKMLICNI